MVMRLLVFFCAAIALLGCAANAAQITVNRDDYLFKWSGSSPTVWTAPSTYRVRSSDSPPSATGNVLRISAAKEELEYFQIIVQDSSSNSRNVNYPSKFADLPSSNYLSCGRATYSPVSSWAQGNYQVVDAVEDIAAGGASFTTFGGRPTVLWCTVYVPGSAAAGTYTQAITVAGTTVNVELYVFNFKLDVTGHFQTYFQSTPTTSQSSYSLAELDAFKQVYMRHRWNSRNTAWSGGFGTSAWSTSDQALIDADPATSQESCVYAAGCLGVRYSTGQGLRWRNVDNPDWIGQPDGTALTGFNVWEFGNVEYSRPANFDGVACGTNPSFSGEQWKGWMCSQQYENGFGKYLRALASFASTYQLNEQFKRAFFYTLNEPSSYNQYTISAYLCKTFKQQAPDLPLMLTREAHPWITDRADSLSCGYDIWVAHVQRYPPDFTWDRQANHGETSWWYSLDTDGTCASPGVCNPSFQPFVSQTGSNSAEDPRPTNDGMHYRVITWAAWANRVTGWGYYKDSINWQPAGTSQTIAPVKPRISASLIAQGLEDYEYFWQANGRQQPAVYSQRPVDATVLSVGFAVNAWVDDVYSLHALRHELGRYVEGSRQDLPYTKSTYTFPRGSYNIDFGPYSLSGNSYGAAVAFTDMGNQWLGVGYPKYDVAAGYGWASQAVGLPNTIQTGNPILRCLDTQAGVSPVVDTICYDDYNHPDIFYLALQPGSYDVTVGVGWPGKSRNDVEYVQINTVVLRNHSCSNDCTGVRNYSATVTVQPHSNGGALVMTVGSPFVNAYTIISYLIVRPNGAGTTGTGTISTATGSSTAASTTASTSTRSRTTTATTSSSSRTGTGTSGGSGGCFAADSLVRSLSDNNVVAVKPLSQLRAGDLVESFDRATLSTSFAPVYFLAHANDERLVPLVQLRTAAGPSLKLTASHLLLVAADSKQQPSMRAARDVRVGDYLLVRVGDKQALQPSRVVAVEQSAGRVVNPLTTSDAIVVADVAASVFVEAEWFYRPVVAPLKLVAHYAPALLRSDSLFAAVVDALVSFTDVAEQSFSSLFAWSVSGQ